MQISGIVGGEPQSQTTQGAMQYINFSVAVRKNRPDRNGQYGTDWVRCTVFGKRAGVIQQYYHKGSRVMVSGQWSVNQWTNKNGQPQFSVELNVNDFDLPERPSSQPNNRPRQQPQPGQSNNQPYPNQNASPDPFANSNDSIQISDDDLPFDWGRLPGWS